MLLNWASFQSSRVHSRLLVCSWCLIFSFLCSVLYIFVCRLSFFFLVICPSILRLQITLWYVQTFLNNVILFLDFNTVIMCQLSIMKRKFKQLLSSIPPIATKRTIASYLNWTHWTQKKTTTYDVGNPGPGMGQAQKYDGVKPVNGIPTLFW